jgi:hypothetical protein
VEKSRVAGGMSLEEAQQILGFDAADAKIDRKAVKDVCFCWSNSLSLFFCACCWFCYCVCKHVLLLKTNDVDCK